MKLPPALPELSRKAAIVGVGETDYGNDYRTARAKAPRYEPPGHDSFWDWCGKGELRLQRCEDCGHITWPVATACEACGSVALAWERMSGKGTLASWCSFERGYYRGLIPLPYDTILVELKEGLLFIANPSGFGREAYVVGLPVALRFLECEDNAGCFSLPVFTLEDA